MIWVLKYLLGVRTNYSRTFSSSILCRILRRISLYLEIKNRI